MHNTIDPEKNEVSVTFPDSKDDSFIERNRISPIAFAFGALFIVFVLYQIIAGGITVLLVGGSVTKNNVLSVRLLTMGGQLLFILLPTLLLARLISSRLSGVFRLRVPTLQETFFATLGLLFLQQIFQIYLSFQDRIPLPEALRRIVDPLKQLMEEMYRVLVTADSIPELVLVLLVVAIVPAIVEELFFRGLIQNSLERAVAPIWAAVIAGFIFGFYHLNPFALIPLIGLGCYFGILRVRSQSIVIAMTLHLINNALAVMLVYFQVENELLLGTKAQSDNIGIESMIAQLFLFLILFVVAVFAYLKSTASLAESSKRS